MKDELESGFELQVAGEADAPVKKKGLSAPTMPSGKLPKIVALAVVALISFFALGTFASDPGTYAWIVSSLDAKRDGILALMASTAGGATALALIPGATPIANELMNISSYFGIVLAAIYLEKYLLTLLGALTFKVLVPAGCVMCIVGLVAGEGSSVKATMFQLAGKAVALGLTLVLVVPCSVWVSDKVESTHAEYVTQENAAALAQDEAEKAAAEAAAAEKAAALAQEQDKAEEADSIPDLLMNSLGNLVNTAGAAVSDTADNVSKQAASAIEDGKRLINQLFEQLAIMVVTACLIPILVLVLFVWIINMVLGTNIQMPAKKKALKPFKAKE